VIDIGQADIIARVHCFAHGNLGEHQRTAALYSQQHFSHDLPLRQLMFRIRPHVGASGHSALQRRR
jgi:hypothetical protein